MADTKETRLNVSMRLLRNKGEVVREVSDSGIITYTEGMWNEAQIATGLGWVALPLGFSMTAGASGILLISDIKVDFSTANSPTNYFTGTHFLVMDTETAGAVTASLGFYIRNMNGSTTANIRYIAVK